MAPKKPPVTSARRRAERASGSKKVAASTPQKRQTSVMQRPFQPGTKTSNTTGQRALPPGKKGGPLAKATKALPPGKKGGPLAKAPTTKPPQRALPAAGQSGGSKPPKGTTTPQRGGPTRTAAQLAQERRSGAASRKAGAAVGSRASNAAPTTIKPNKPNIVSKGLSKAGSPKGAGAGAAASFIAQLPEELRRARTGYYNLSKPNAERYNNLKQALGGVDPAKYFGTKLSGKGATKAPMPKGASAALREKSYASLQKFQLPKPKATAKPAAKASTPKASSAPTRSSVPVRSSAPARPAVKPAAARKPSAGPESEFSGMSVADMMKGYGMRVNQTFSAESAALAKKRQSLKEQTAEIKKMIEESKKRQGKG